MNLVGRLQGVMGGNMARASLGPGSAERAAGHAGHLRAEHFPLQGRRVQAQPSQACGPSGSVERKRKAGSLPIGKGPLRCHLAAPDCGPLCAQVEGTLGAGRAAQGPLRICKVLFGMISFNHGS